MKYLWWPIGIALVVLVIYAGESDSKRRAREHDKQKMEDAQALSEAISANQDSWPLPHAHLLTPVNVIAALKTVPAPPTETYTGQQRYHVDSESRSPESVSITLTTEDGRKWYAVWERENTKHNDN